MPTSTDSSEPAGDGRRGFVAKTAAVLIGGLISLFPVAAGVFTFANPLRRRTKEAHDGSEQPGRLLRVATLAAVPDDGLPRQFPVIADRQDAWTRYPDEAIGAVYLRRQPGSNEVEAFNATCPHLGCFVGFNQERNKYQCPCHKSAFSIDGETEYGPSPRNLDRLDTELKPADNPQEIWVRYVDYITGVGAQIPKNG
jgi:menaquinol-cytochrome c reductase iron-sulfur subunit